MDATAEETIPEEQEDARPRQRGQQNINLTRNEKAMARRNQFQEEQPEAQKLSNGYIILMCIIAAGFDGITGVLGLFIGPGNVIADFIINPLGIVVITGMFLHKGVSFRRKGKLAGLVIPFILKFIPILSIFTGFLLDVLWVSYLERKKE